MGSELHKVYPSNQVSWHRVSGSIDFQLFLLAILPKPVLKRPGQPSSPTFECVCLETLEAPHMMAAARCLYGVAQYIADQRRRLLGWQAEKGVPCNVSFTLQGKKRPVKEHLLLGSPSVSRPSGSTLTVIALVVGNVDLVIQGLYQ